MSIKNAVYATIMVVVLSSPAAQADPFIYESFTGYPDNALISASPAGPALGLTGDWYLDAENFFYVNMTAADPEAGTDKAVYDMPFDDNGARTAQRFTSVDHVLLRNDGDVLYASFRILLPRSSGHMIFTLVLDRLDGGGQADVSFGMINDHFIIGNGGEDVDVSRLNFEENHDMQEVIGPNGQTLRAQVVHMSHERIPEAITILATAPEV